MAKINPDNIPNEHKFPCINVCTVGHQYSGKTELFNALQDLAGKPDLKFSTAYSKTSYNVEIEYDSSCIHYLHIDTSGSSENIKNMITAAAQVDCAVLVVDATEGVLPQTREHVFMARSVKTPYIIVFINKCDLVNDQDYLSIIEDEIRHILLDNQYNADETIFIRGSAKNYFIQKEGEGEEINFPHNIDLLMKAMDEHIPKPPMEILLPFRLSVEDVFKVFKEDNTTMDGLIGTGRIEFGQTDVGEIVEITGFGRQVFGVVHQQEFFRKSTDKYDISDNVGILIKERVESYTTSEGKNKKFDVNDALRFNNGKMTDEEISSFKKVLLTEDDIQRGQLIMWPGNVKELFDFEYNVWFIDPSEGGKEAPLTKENTVVFYLRTTEVAGKLIFDKNTTAYYPNTFVSGKAKLKYGVPLCDDMRFAIREDNKIIAVGSIFIPEKVSE